MYDRTLVLSDVIVERTGRTHGVCNRKQTQQKLIGFGRFPTAVSPVAVESYIYTTLGIEGKHVLCLIVGYQRRIITTLKLLRHKVETQNFASLQN